MGKLPGVHTKIKPTGKIVIKKDELKEFLTAREIKALCGSDKFPVCIDLSASCFSLKLQDFLRRIPADTLKDIDLSGNDLTELTYLNNQSKLRRLIADNNFISKVSFQNLISCKHISLAENNIATIPDMNDLQRIVYLNLRGNRISGGFENIVVLKSLKYLDLSKNNIKFTVNEFYMNVIVPLQCLPKLTHFIFDSNPLENNIPNLKYLIINELPKLQFYNGEKISKADKTKAEQMNSTGEFNIKTGNTSINVRIPNDSDEENNIYDNNKRGELSGGRNSSKQNLANQMISKYPNDRSFHINHINYPEDEEEDGKDEDEILEEDDDDEYDPGYAGYEEEIDEIDRQINYFDLLNDMITDSEDKRSDSGSSRNSSLRKGRGKNNNNNFNTDRSTASTTSSNNESENFKRLSSIDLISKYTKHLQLIDNDAKNDDDEEQLHSLLNELTDGTISTQNSVKSPSFHEKLNTFSNEVPVDEDNFFTSIKSLAEGYNKSTSSVTTVNTNNSTTSESSFTSGSYKTSVNSSNTNRSINSNNTGSFSSFRGNSNFDGSDFFDEFSENVMKPYEEPIAVNTNNSDNYFEEYNPETDKIERRPSSIEHQQFNERLKVSIQKGKLQNSDQSLRKIAEELDVDKSKPVSSPKRVYRTKRGSKTSKPNKETTQNNHHDEDSFKGSANTRLSKKQLHLSSDDDSERKKELHLQLEQFKRNKQIELEQRKSGNSFPPPSPPHHPPPPRPSSTKSKEEQDLDIAEQKLLEKQQLQLKLQLQQLQYNKQIPDHHSLIQFRDDNSVPSSSPKKDNFNAEEELFNEMWAFSQNSQSISHPVPSSSSSSHSSSSTPAATVKLISTSSSPAPDKLIFTSDPNTKLDKTLKITKPLPVHPLSPPNSSRSLPQPIGNNSQSPPQPPPKPKSNADLSPPQPPPKPRSQEQPAGEGNFSSNKTLRGVDRKLYHQHLEQVQQLQLQKHQTKSNLLSSPPPSQPQTRTQPSHTISHPPSTQPQPQLTRKLTQLPPVQPTMQSQLQLQLQPQAPLLLQQQYHQQRKQSIAPTPLFLQQQQQQYQQQQLLSQTQPPRKATEAEQRTTLKQQPSFLTSYHTTSAPSSSPSDRILYTASHTNSYNTPVPYQPPNRQIQHVEYETYLNNQKKAGEEELILNQIHQLQLKQIQLQQLINDKQTQIFGHGGIQQPFPAQPPLLRPPLQSSLSPPFQPILSYLPAQPRSLEKVDFPAEKKKEEEDYSYLINEPSVPLPSSPSPSQPLPAQPPSVNGQSNGSNTASVLHQIKQINQILSTNQIEIQLKALKALLYFGKIENNIVFIIQSNAFFTLNNILNGIPITNDQLIEFAAHIVGSFCIHPIAEKSARENNVNQSLVNLLISPPIPLNEMTIVRVIKAISVMATNIESQEIIRTSGAIFPLMNLLNSTNQSIQAQSVRALSILLEDQVSQEYFGKYGGSKLLEQLLNSSNPAIQLPALIILCNLMFTDTFTSDFPLFQNISIFQRFLQFLQSSTPSLRLRALKAAERFSKRDEMRMEITKQGGIDYLVLLLNPNNDERTIKVALSTLAYYTNTHLQLLAFKRANGLQSVVNLLSHNNPLVQYHSLKFFFEFINQSNINKEIVKAIAFIPKCVGLMTSPHPPSQLMACQIIQSLTSNVNCLQSINESGALPQVLGLLKLATATDEIRELSLLTLSKLLSFDSSIRRTILSSPEVITSLFSMLRSTNMDVKENTSFILTDINQSHEIGIYGKNLKYLSLLSQMIITSKSDELIEKLLTLFTEFTSNVENHKLLRDSNTFPSYIHHINSPNPNIQRLAVKSTLTISSNLENREELIRINAMQALSILGQSPSHVYQLASSKCLSYLTM